MAGPTYTYTPDVPLGPTPMNETQPTILENFRAINELIGVDHIGFNIPNDFGKHNKLSLQFQTDTPTSTSTGINLFCQATPDGDNAAEIFIQYPTGATSSIVQLSNPVASSTTGPGTSGTGYTKFSSLIAFNYSSFLSSNIVSYVSGSPGTSGYAAGFFCPLDGDITYIGNSSSFSPNGSTEFIFQAVTSNITFYYFIVGTYTS